MVCTALSPRLARVERLLSTASGLRQVIAVLCLLQMGHRQGWRSTYLVYVLELPCCGGRLGEVQLLVFDIDSACSLVDLDEDGLWICGLGSWMLGMSS